MHTPPPEEAAGLFFAAMLLEFVFDDGDPTTFYARVEARRSVQPLQADVERRTRR